MTRKHKCASCIHCEMCKWVDEVKQSGCDFYAASCDDIAKERYADLCAYFGEAKVILKNRKDFTDWLKRVKWYIHKAEELSNKYERNSEPCDGVISRQNNLSGLSPNATLGDIILAIFPDFMKNTLLISNEEDFKKFAELGKNLVRLEDWNTPCKKDCDNCGKRYCGNALCFANEYCEWMPIQTDGIKVGDEVEHNFNLYKVVGITESGNCFCIGKYTRSFPKADLKKTGRHFSQIPEALAQACKGGEKNGWYSK